MVEVSSVERQGIPDLMDMQRLSRACKINHMFIYLTLDIQYSHSKWNPFCYEDDYLRERINRNRSRKSRTASVILRTMPVS